MDLPQLRYFCDVAQTQHMTQSSKRLNVVQPALSQAIHRLESELGVKLFDRKGRNIRLTEEGALFYARVSEMLAGLDAASAEMRSMAEDRRNLVRVGVSSATNIVVDAIAGFAAQNPEATFEISKDTDKAAVDIAVKTVVDGGAGTVMDDGEVHFSEPIGIAVPLESSYGSNVSLEELSEERFIRLAGSKSFRGVCDSVCSAYGFVPKVAFESDDPSVAKKIISLGLGVGFWPRISWGGLEGSGARWCTLAQEGFVRTLAVSRAPLQREAPMADAFFSFIVQYMRKLWE